MDKQLPPEKDKSVMGTMRIDPDEYKPSSNKTNWERAKYALAGIFFLIRREQSIRNLLVAIVLVFGLALWLELPLLHDVIILIAFSIIWVVEALNSAVEAVVDLSTQEIHPMAKVAKDVAASASFVATFTTVIVVLALLGPPLFERLFS